MIHRDHSGPEFVRPFHVAANYLLEFDQNLFVSLLNCCFAEGWEHLREAILVFNSANTDADGGSDEFDLVLMRVAFEALLKANHTEEDLSKKLRQAIGMTSPLRDWPDGEFDKRKWHSRWSADRPITAWVKDFCAARNRNAHSEAGSTGLPLPLWSDRNHLMFAAWLFPLVVKSVLAQGGAYQMTPHDHDRLELCEEFLAVDVSAWSADDARLRWSDVEQKVSARELARALDGL